jgi:hypothetical protein
MCKKFGIRKLHDNHGNGKIPLYKLSEREVTTIPSTPTAGEDQDIQHMEEDSSDDEMALQQTQ